jgi:hypothetical protein
MLRKRKYHLSSETLSKIPMFFFNFWELVNEEKQNKQFEIGLESILCFLSLLNLIKTQILSKVAKITVIAFRNITLWYKDEEKNIKTAESLKCF